MQIYRFVLIIFLLLSVISCANKTQKKEVDVKITSNNSVKKKIKEKVEGKQERKYFKSTLDTLISDSIKGKDYVFYIKTLEDSVYNELYYAHVSNTNVLKNPYEDNSYKRWKEIEVEQIKTSINPVVRKHDTLLIKLDKEVIELINSDWGSYWYVKYLKELNCHLVYEGGEGGGFLFYSSKIGKIDLPTGHKLFFNTELNQIIYCDFYGNVLGGGWTNYFTLLEMSSENVINKKFSIPLNTDYGAKQNWGLTLPVWISENSFICKYKLGIIDESTNEADYQYCFVQVEYKEETIEKSLPTNKVVNKDFQKFLEQLDFIEIPYETNCFAEYMQGKVLSQELIKKFSDNELEYPYKRIASTDKFEMLMFLVPADALIPIIKTYDFNGKIIDTEQLLWGYCGGEPGYYHTEHIRIVSSNLITHIDSTWTYDIDADYNKVNGTEKFELKVIDFMVNDDGSIEKREK